MIRHTVEQGWVHYPECTRIPYAEEKSIESTFKFQWPKWAIELANIVGVKEVSKQLDKERKEQNLSFL